MTSLFDALPPEMAKELMEYDGEEESSVPVRRGEAIFEGTDYPRDWAGFVGQEVAKAQLLVAIASAQARGDRLDHLLLSSGIAGVGKTTLATLTAFHAGVGLVQTTGPLSADEGRQLLMGMQDHDILFVDEAHKLVEGNRNRADWLLPWMLEGKLYTRAGAVQTPKVTLMAATTDAGKMPETLLSRFMLRPQITRYCAEEAALIAQRLAGRMNVTGLPQDYYVQVATAASHNPRVMRRILTTLRDLALAAPGEAPDLGLALEWSGVSADGLDSMAQDMMLVLLASAENRASIETIQAQLNEPGPLRHAEQALLQRGYISITGRGRQLTDAGRSRAIGLVRERRG